MLLVADFSCPFGYATSREKTKNETIGRETLFPNKSPFKFLNQF